MTRSVSLIRASGLSSSLFSPSVPAYIDRAGANVYPVDGRTGNRRFDGAAHISVTGLRGGFGDRHQGVSVSTETPYKHGEAKAAVALPGPTN